MKGKAEREDWLGVNSLLMVVVITTVLKMESQ